MESIGWGIAQSKDGSTGEDLLPSISPTFEWIRLARRVPVRVHVEQIPEEVELRVGTTWPRIIAPSGSLHRRPLPGHPPNAPRHR